jgi:hypothetical protein
MNNNVNANSSASLDALSGAKDPVVLLNYLTEVAKSFYDKVTAINNRAAYMAQSTTNEVYTCLKVLGAKKQVQEVVDLVRSPVAQFDFERFLPIPASAFVETKPRRTVCREWVRDNTGGLPIAGSIKFCEPGTFFFSTAPAPALPLVRALSAKYPNVTICAWFYDRHAVFAASATFLGGAGLVREMSPYSKEGREIAAMTQRAAALRAEKWATKLYNYPSAAVNAVVPSPVVPPGAVVKPPTVVTAPPLNTSSTRN